MKELRNRISTDKVFMKVSLAVLLAILVLIYICNKVVVFDRSGERAGNDLLWNGTTYVSCSGSYTEHKRIAKTTDGFDIIEIEEDDTHTFVVLRSFLDQELMVDINYTIPQSGKLTSVSWNDTKITEEEFCSVVADIISRATTDFEYTTDGIFILTENQKMREVMVGYNNCPVSTEYIGYMGLVNGTWCITTEISKDQRNPDGSPKAYSVSCYTIPQEYIEIVEKYWKD